MHYDLTLISLSLLSIVVWLSGAAILVCMGRKAYRFRQQRNVLQHRYAAELDAGTAFLIRYCDAGYFETHLKWFAWQSIGILRLDKKMLEIVLGSGDSLHIAAASVRCHWHGRRFAWNGPYAWIQLYSEPNTHYVSAANGFTRRSSTQTWSLYTALLLWLQQEKPTPVITAAKRFALEKNPASLIVLLVSLLFAVYFVIDQVFLLDETYITFPHQGYFIVAGMLGLIAGYVALQRAQVPPLETHVLAVLCCLLTATALYPGLRRINQFSDVAGMQAYMYRFGETRLLLPPKADLPRLSVALDPEFATYWQQFRPGDAYPIGLRRGGLGFYQLDMAAVEHRIEAFYAGQQRDRQQALHAPGSQLNPVE